MKIGGLLPFSLCDFPGRTCAVLFAQGCNFQCPWCHNGSLIPVDVPPDKLVPEAEVLQFLQVRRGQLDGVVVSGGEPTLQADLPEFLSRVKMMGFKLKLDTNGSRPDVLRTLLRDGLIDFIAMDVKAPMRVYDRLAGVHAPVDEVKESIAVIAGSGLTHEFRTTVVRQLLSDQDLEYVRKMIPSGSPHRFQTFRPENALDPTLRG